MKKTALQPIIYDEDVIVQFTDNIVFDKALAVTVPNGYAAFVFADEKPKFRVEACTEKKIISRNKELLGKIGRIAFVRVKPMSPMGWGFGNIQVNNARLKEAYRVGANGKYIVDIVQPAKLTASFVFGDNVTVEKIRERTLSAVKTVGMSLLGAYFADTTISVFEIISCISDFRTKFLQALQRESVFAELGLVVKDLTVDGIHVPEEDIMGIRSRINEYGDNVSNNIQTEQEEVVAELSRKIEQQFDKLREHASRQNEGSDAVAQISTIRQEIIDELSQRLGSKMQEMQETLFDSLDERLQEFSPLKERAEEAYLKNLKVTAGFLIDQAADEDALVPAAAMLYTNVEENLIKKFRLRHENKKFAMTYDEYCSLAKEEPILLSKYDTVSPMILHRDSDGNPEIVEMPPQVRFYKVGLDLDDSLKARDYWCFLNKLRHRSPENDAVLRKRFSSLSQEKQYLADVMEFFKTHGLYTKE